MQIIQFPWHFPCHFPIHSPVLVLHHLSLYIRFVWGMHCDSNLRGVFDKRASGSGIQLAAKQRVKSAYRYAAFPHHNYEAVKQGSVWS